MGLRDLLPVTKSRDEIASNRDEARQTLIKWLLDSKRDELKPENVGKLWLMKKRRAS